MNLKGKKIFIVCSDPGASQTLPPLIKELGVGKAYIFVIARRSGRYFADKFGIEVNKDEAAYSDYGAIKRFINQEKPDFIITGTSLKDDLERNYIKAARSLKIPVLSIVDWWTGFRIRFTHSKTKKFCLPDWICVVDDIAKHHCIREIGSNKVNVVITGNPYFSRILTTLKASRTGAKPILSKLQKAGFSPTILFFAEPLFRGYNQFEIFRRVIREVSKVASAYDKTFNLIIKFHPNGEIIEIYRNYESMLRKGLNSNCKVHFIKKKYNVTKLIEGADYVWGMSTTPMLEAMLRGKLVSSFLHEVDFPGVPFVKKANFCPSADNYAQYPDLVKKLLTNKKFISRAMEKQKRYRVPKEDFGNRICEILESKLLRKVRHG